jgi:hypothetical protein
MSTSGLIGWPRSVICGVCVAEEHRVLAQALAEASKRWWAENGVVTTEEALARINRDVLP